MTPHPTSHPIRYGWLALLPVALLLLAACGKTEANPPARAPEAPRAVTASLVTAEERRIPNTLDVTGTLMADAQTDLASEIEQRVVEILVERGQFISAGQVVARLDAADAENQLREAEATEAEIRERLGLTDGESFDPLKTPEVQQARAVLERAEADYKRYAQLVEEGAVSRADHDLRRADYLAAKAQYGTSLNQMRQIYQSLLAQKVRVAMGRKAVADSIIRAPYSGLIAEKCVSVGRYMKKGDRVATLVRVDPLRIELTIPEGAISAVRKGQKVSFRVQSHPDHEFGGVIAYVGPALRADARALVVEAIVPNPQGQLQPGLFATAGIELPALRSSIVVPATALRLEDGVYKLFVAKADRAELRMVQIGRDAAGLVEIQRGLAAGERVVNRPATSLADGALVAPAPEGK